VTPATDEGARKPTGLLHVLGLGFGLAVIVGSTLGVGILRTPGLVASDLGSRSLILFVWVFGGIYTLLGSVCLTELGTMLPQAGGYYVYARRAFGDTLGFAVGWTDWLTYCAVLGYASIGVGEFSGMLLGVGDLAQKEIAIGSLIGLTALQWTGVRVSSRFQQWTTAVKCLAFLALVAACFAHSGSAVSLSSSRSSAGPTLAGVVAALQSVVITYGGWQSALYFTEEDRNVPRNLPRSMIGGVVSVIVIYLLVNLALLAVLPLETLSKSTLPAADAARMIAGNAGNRTITILSIVSLVPLLNAIMMIGTRILFALGRDRLLPSLLGRVDGRGTPFRAMLVTTVVAALLISIGTFTKLVAVASFFLAANYCASCLALFALRRKEPETPRPFVAWGYPLTAAIVLGGAVVFLVASLTVFLEADAGLKGDTSTILWALGLLAVGVLVRLTSTSGELG
jgi:APA family basic amino acid/polyamine antiporter